MCYPCARFKVLPISPTVQVSFNVFKENPSDPSRRSGALAAQADAARHLPLKRGGEVWSAPLSGNQGIIRKRRMIIENQA